MSSHNPASETKAYRPAWAWTPDGLVRAPVIAVRGDGRIGAHGGEPVEDRPGLLVPGFVNTHVHLEIPAFPFERGAGLLPWVRNVRVHPPTAAQAGAGVVAAIRAGTAAVGEISNTGLSTPVMAAAGMPGRVWREVLGIDNPDGEGDTPHAPHTTHPAVIRRAASAGNPWSIHFDEDPQEAEFLHGRGEWLAFMRSVGRDLDAFEVPRLSPARYLAALGVLSPRSLLVHATCTRGHDLDVIAEAGAPVALCARSNRAITGRTPDVRGMVERGIRLTIGTDSLGSAPDLDPLAEAAALRPLLDPHALLRALTETGADVLGLPLGRVREGEAPGLLLIDLPASDDPLSLLFDGTRWRRRWLACPSV